MGSDTNTVEIVTQAPAQAEQAEQAEPAEAGDTAATDAEDSAEAEDKRADADADADAKKTEKEERKRARKAAKAAEKAAKRERKKAEKAQKAKVEFETRMDREEAASFLANIVDGLRAGVVSFRQDDQHLELEVPRELALELEAVRKGEKIKIELELAWRQTASKAPPTLTTVPDEPEDTHDSDSASDEDE